MTRLSRSSSCGSMLRLAFYAALFWHASWARAEVRTWDGKYAIDHIEVTVVYFVPADRQPLPDWTERAGYFCRRIELFHRREFQGQSTLTTRLHPEPIRSKLTTQELRVGDGDAIFFRTLREVDARIGGTRSKEQDAFPILLVLSDINWRPLDDFYRLAPNGGDWVFEGNLTNGEHFPGAASGGARATYLANRGAGWGLVSADGWRVPYRGSDCVVYHEGCGHTVGLPHPQPGNGSVMSLGQYRGWLSESWLDREQKLRLGWVPPEVEPASDTDLELFTSFRALPEPRVPRPNEPVALALDWPPEVKVRKLRVRYQTALGAPWVDVPQHWEGDAPSSARLGTFDRATPVSYRVDVELQNGATAELWGYLQVRDEPASPPPPSLFSRDLTDAVARWHIPLDVPSPPKETVDLLPLIDLDSAWKVGDWTRDNGLLTSPKLYGARIELPYAPPDEYRLTLIVEPLDPPHGLILGQRLDARRFVSLVHYMPDAVGLSALENIDGRNVGNDTTYSGNLLAQGRLSQIIVTVRKGRVTMMVDGRTIVDWRGDAQRLSLSDYWKTPDDRALFLGAYDCHYRFHRCTLEPISGTGTVLSQPDKR